MMKNDVKLKVLWIDDQQFPAFINTALEEYNIEIHQKASWEDAGPFLENNNYTKWDAIILDCYCKIHNDDPGENDKFLHEVLYKIAHIVGKDILPWYVLSAGHHDNFIDIIDRDLHDDRLLWDSEWEQIYYGKIKINEDTGKKDTEALLENILSYVSNSEKYKLKKQFADVFSLSDEIESDLINILPYLDSSMAEKTEVFNQIRKVLDWVMRYCNQVGILPVAFAGSNISDCSRALMHNLVPTGIQRSFHSCVEIANEGSHRVETEVSNKPEGWISVDQSVRNGQAPYLIRSTIYELLNILHWCKSLPTDEWEQKKLSKKVQEIIGNNDDKKNAKANEPQDENSRKYENHSGIVEFDGENYHVGECLVNERNSSNVGKMVIISDIKMNTIKKSKDAYPYYAGKCYPERKIIQ